MDDLPPADASIARDDAPGKGVGASAEVETELKLDVPPRLAARVLAHRALRVKPVGRFVRSHLLGIYYDTPKFDLWQARICVRLRRSPAGWVQTVKWAGGALGGLHQRNELEWTVPEQRLAFDGIAPRAGLEALLDVRLQRRLKPVFVTEFERAARILALPDGSRIEASLDRGRIVCGTTVHPICELELELEAGAPGALFDVAQALLADLPLRPAHRSKAERGYLLAGLAVAPVKARRTMLDPAADLRAAVAAFVGSGLEQVQSNEYGMLHGNGIEYLHQMRVGVRRLRSCLSAFGPALPKAGLDPLRSELKWFGARLGSARDWDVFAEEALPVLRTGLAEVADAQALDALAAATQAVRERAGRAARMAVRSRRGSALLLALGRVAAGGGVLAAADVSGQPARDYGSALLERRLDRVIRRGKRVRKAAGVEDLHALRIAVKKLRYALEFVGALYGSQDEVARYRDRLVKLQDCLGRICDAAAMPARIAEALPGSGALLDCVRGWSACALHVERARLRRLWRAFRDSERFW